MCKVKFITSALMVMLSWQSVRAECTFTGAYETVCIGYYMCNYTIGDLSSEIRHWGCRIDPHRFSSWPHRKNQPILYSNAKYLLNIKIENENSGYDFVNIMEYNDHIITISVRNGNLTTIPYGIYNLAKLTSLDVSYNNISSFELTSILPLENLEVFNASFNSITDLIVAIYNRPGSNVSSIDLSHNAIDVIPDNYFIKFPKLLHLNMSHNAIKSFTILSFEGLAELETLHLSHNEIEKIGMNFARFQYLKELSLDYNAISSLEEINFKIMSKLVKLNLSYNKIISIDELCFQNMMSLEKLQLNNNIIEAVSKSMFINNKELQALDLSGNHITTIESYSFKGKYITQLFLHNNSITGLLDKSIFVGVSTDILDFSGNNITSLGADLFTESHLQLRSLNFSSNSISDIHENAFRTLGFLTHLDLSKNRLQSLNFDFKDLNSLTIFKAEGNVIENITRDTFRNLKSLTELDLSSNRITKIDPFSFNDLEHLQVLDLSKNLLPSIIASHTFNGLCSTLDLNLTVSKVNTIQDGAFYGMTNLTFLNVSYGDLQVLNYNVFNNTGSIWTLDLSHNRMEIFLVNNTDLKYLTELYLNDNQIIAVTNETFTGLNRLLQLNLNNNNILRIENGALYSLHTVSSMVLSSNVDMMLDSSIFSNLSLSDVSLHDVWKPFGFGNAKNVSILRLDLSLCNISNIYTLTLQNVAKLEKLLLYSNKIQIIDTYSFKNLSTLIFLDLSDNLISLIKPGSFAGTSEIDVLNLSSNNLISLKFGVFDGLAKLRVLNLSSNSLHTFKGNLFHNSHRIWIVSLDNNMIDTIDFEEINSAMITKITIGGNLLSCEFLAKAKKSHYFGVTVTAEIKEFHSENIDGMSCRGSNIDGNQHIGSNESSKVIDKMQINYSGSLNSQTIVNKLGDLKSVLYFEASCLLVIVMLLVAVLSFIYFKFRSKLERSYSFNSRRHLTGTTIEMEL